MDKTLSYLVYSPPKSNSHGHGVRDKNIRRATQRVIDSFVENFNATTDNKVQLTLYYNKKNESEKTRNTIEKLNEFLGPLKNEWNNAGFEHHENSITWETERTNILELLDYADTLKGDDFLPLSKYWICCSYHYGTSPEPYGYLMCSVESGGLFVRMHLIFPCPIDDEKCFDLLFKFHRSLPFKLNGKHFRRLGPGKRSYSQWKLEEDLQKRVDACLIESKAKLKGG